MIPNYKFFLSNPTTGDNTTGLEYGNGNSGTCGPVAAQLLLGYANYYNDRRIIADNFLNGYDDDTNTVMYAHRNPNYCSDPMTRDRFTTGTRSSATGQNSFYVEMITRIMEPNTSGADVDEVYGGIVSYLEDRETELGIELNYILNSQEEVNIFGKHSTIDSALIKAELKAGRPLIIGMHQDIGGVNHFVVGYGYQSYSYTNGSGEYEGYVVYFGRFNDEAEECVWINSSWCDSYISLKFNHVHDYYTVGTITGTNRTEYKCYTCGHRTDAAIRILSSDRYVESVVTLTQGQYKDYYLTCKAEGAKLMQTFGLQDTKLELYDAEYNLIVASEDEGFNKNALITYYLYANTAYILRVISNDSSESNTVKLAVFPAYGVSAANSYIANYEDIYPVQNYIRYSFETFAQPGYVRAITFDPRVTYDYTLTIDSDFDTFIYVIDPYSTDILIVGENYDDDSGEGLNPSLTTMLITGIPYLIIYSAYNPSALTETKNLTLSIEVSG